MRVKDIMTTDPACCTPDSSLRDVAKMMAECDCGQIPVVDDRQAKRPVGVVTDRDIVMRTLAQGMDPMRMTAKDVMSKPAITVRPDTPLEECCRTMEQRQVRRAPVVDERGACCGMVALADIAQQAPERITVEVVKMVSQPQHA